MTGQGRNKIEAGDTNFQYKIGRLTYVQDELTYGQDEEILTMLDKVRQIAPDTAEVNMREPFNLFKKFNLLGNFAGIFLKPKSRILQFLIGIWNIIHLRPWHYVNLAPAPNSTFKQIIVDFFFLNRTLIESLASLENALSLVAKTAMQMSKSKAKTPSTPTTPKKSGSSGKSSNTTPPADGSKTSESSTNTR